MAATVAICSADTSAVSGAIAFQYFISNSASSFMAGISGPSHESAVSTTPPLSSSVLPFSRTVTVMTTCFAS
jgi:hypothetical protein